MVTFIQAMVGDAAALYGWFGGACQCQKRDGWWLVPPSSHRLSTYTSLAFFKLR
jgi:hypothetical protein